MTLAALVDAGADRDYIEQELSKIQIEPFHLEWKKVNKKGISSLKMDVVLDPHKQPNHHRHYSEIVRMIETVGFNDYVKAISLAIFEKIGIAEAKIHDIPLEHVHFHEVGAIDSIVDVIGIALALDSLHIERIICSPVPLGSGTVRCDHGIYPVPAPATLEMMRGLPIAPTPYSMEMTTPTGAGVVSGIVHEFSKGLPPMVVESIGYGAGTRDLPNQPNVLRAIIGSADPYLPQWQIQHGITQLAQQEHAHTEHHHHHHHGHDHQHGHEHGHSHGHDDHGHSHDYGHKKNNPIIHERKVLYRPDHNHGHSHDHDHPHEHDHNHKHDDDDHRHTHGSNPKQ
jgi:uncharacterized protein (DUF111 family)